MSATTTRTDALIEDMLHGDGIPQCDEWDRLRDLCSQLESELFEAKADAAAVRELMNAYNLGGWTDAVEPMKRALRAEASGLIAAAAPDLLAALQHCLREHGGYTIKGETERLAKAAIAKATGSAQP